MPVHSTELVSNVKCVTMAGIPRLAGDKYLESETIEMVVGPKKETTTFHVHKTLLIHSNFFRACLENGHRETKHSKISLPDDDVDAVRWFVIWLYRGNTFDIVKHDQEPLTIRVYAFAEKICYDEFHNSVMDSIRLYFQSKDCTSYSPSSIVEIYALCSRTSALARFAISLLTYTSMTNPAKHTTDRDAVEQWSTHEDLSQDLLLLSIFRYKQTAWKTPAKWQGCHFHVYSNVEKQTVAQEVAGPLMTTTPPPTTTASVPEVEETSPINSKKRKKSTTYWEQMSLSRIWGGS